MMRVVLAVVLSAAILFLLAGMFLYPSEELRVTQATSQTQADPATFPPSAPLQKYEFPNYGFQFSAPADWRVLPEDELRGILEADGEEFNPDDVIIGLTPAQPAGLENAVVQVLSMQEPMDDAALGMLQTLSTVYKGADWLRPSSWAGRSWMRVATSPYVHDVDGYAAASMELDNRTRTQNGESKDSQMLITVVELPREAIMLGAVLTDDPFRNQEARDIFASFTAIGVD